MPEAVPPEESRIHFDFKQPVDIKPSGLVPPHTHNHSAGYMGDLSTNSREGGVRCWIQKTRKRTLGRTPPRVHCLLVSEVVVARASAVARQQVPTKKKKRAHTQCKIWPSQTREK